MENEELENLKMKYNEIQNKLYLHDLLLFSIADCCTTKKCMQILKRYDEYVKIKDLDANTQKTNLCQEAKFMNPIAAGGYF